MLAFDDTTSRRPRGAASTWAQARGVEREYAARLRAIARHIEELIRGLIGRREQEEISDQEVRAIVTRLNAYADVLEPWARAAGERMVREAERANYAAWLRHSRQISRVLRAEVYQAPAGAIMQEALARQVELITSLPREAAERVQRLAIEGFVGGRRAGEIRTLEPQERWSPALQERLPEGLAKEILLTGEVTVSRANTIARTESSRVHAELTSARAQAIGSTHFVWRATLDADTRPMHRKLNGTIHQWNDPPVADEQGRRYLPGAGVNCRCIATPVLPPAD